jgi:FKBP-type peptidyl-prolyl cis-trans isomerase SlyD
MMSPMHISAPCVVSLTWRLEDAHGQLIDDLGEPVEFFFGGDDLFAKVEEVLTGQGVGYQNTLHLEPEHAFGDYHAELVFFEERSIFPDEVTAGMQFEGPPDGSVTPDMPTDVIYTVTEVYDTHVVLDGNHPLAGVALVLQLEVCGVREATDEEIAQGSVGDGAGEGGLFSVVPPGATLH